MQISSSECYVSLENMLVIDNSGKGLKKLDRPEVTESTVQCTTLILDKNGLSKVDHLEVYPHLQQLSIANNRLIRMNGVSKLRTLRVLNIPNNSIQSIEGLRELLELEWLNLSGNSLKNVEHLSTNVNLRYLDLSDNSISIISDVSMLKQLKTLLLHGNILTTLRSFPAYVPTSLEILSLAENEISDLAEVSYLSCLSQLKQLSVMNNPCVMFNASSSSSHGGFDYRPFVVNWCLTLELLDGNTITQKESLRAEWLYSQGKGRKFYPGQHFQLAEYLSQTCPLTTASDLQSKEDERLRKVLKQQEKHMHELRTGHTPRHTPTTPRPASSPTSPGMLESTQTSKIKPAKSPGVGKPRQEAKPLKSPVGKSPSPPYVGSPQMTPTKAWPLITPSRNEPVLHKNFQPGGKSSTNAVDILLQDIDESVSEEILDSTSVHLLSVNSGGPPDKLKLPRISPSSGSRGRSHTFDGAVTKMTAPQFPSIRMEDLAEDSDGQSSSSLSQYDIYENRPLKPPQLVKSYLDQLRVDGQKSYEDRDPTAGWSKTELNKREDHSRFVEKTVQREKGNRGPAICGDELRHIKDVAKTKRRLKRAVTPDGGVREVKGQETKQRARKLSAPDDSGRDFEKDHAATKIQAVWRGLQARHKDQAILSVHDTLKSKRIDDHVQFLTMELERTRQLYEQEKHLRVLQMEALKLLWNQVKTLQEWKHSVDSSKMDNSTHHQDKELTDMKRQDHHTKSQEHRDVNQEDWEVHQEYHDEHQEHCDEHQEHHDKHQEHHDEHQEHHNIARHREHQLEQTCDNLQKQVSRLQASLDQISCYITASQHLPGPLLGPQRTEEEKQPSSDSEKQCNKDKTKKSKGSELSITTPKNVQASQRSTTSIGVMWDPALVVDGSRSEVGTSVAGYKLHIDLRGSMWVMEVPGTQTSLGGLVPGTYKFAVSAFKSNLASARSAWIEINLPQYPAIKGEQTLHHLERESPCSEETHQTETKSTTLTSDAKETGHDQDESNTNLVRSKVIDDDSSVITQENGDGVAVPGEESRRDGNVASDIAREMSVQIIDSLLNRVLLEDLNGPYVSSQNNCPGENSSMQDDFISGVDPKCKLVKKEQSFTADNNNSLLQSVMLDDLDSDEQECTNHLDEQSENCPNIMVEDILEKCETRRVEQQGRGMKKPGQSKIAATFNFSDSSNVKGDGVVATTVVVNSKGTKKPTDSMKEMDHLQETAKEEATFDVLLPVEKLIQDGTLCRGKEADDDDIVFDDSQNIDSLRSDNPDQIQPGCNSKRVATPVVKPRRRKYGADKRTSGSSNLQPLQQYNHVRAKSNSEVTKAASPLSAATSNKLKLSRGKCSQPRKVAGNNFGVRRSGSEPNLSLTDSCYAGSKPWPSNIRNDKNSQRNNQRRGSAGGTCGMPKAGAIKNARAGKNNDLKTVQRQCKKDHHAGAKRSQGSIIPALISPGFHYPSNSSKLPMKQTRNKGSGTSKVQRKPSEKVTVHSGRNGEGVTMEVRQPTDVNMYENSNNCNAGLEELIESWETVSSGE